MLTTWYEQGGIPVTIEVNDVKMSPARNVPNTRNGVRVGVIVKCEGGELRGGRGGMYAVGPDGQEKIAKFPGDGGRTHQANFIEAVRAGDADKLAVSIEDAERSATVAHLANLSLRCGGSANAEAIADAAGDREIVHKIAAEQRVQLAAWGVDTPDYQLGNVLQVNPDTGAVSGEGLDPNWVRNPGRGEFVVPKLV